MIHESAISQIIERKNAKGVPVPFSLKFIKLSTGETVTAENVICTSSHFHPRTYNLRWPNEQFRKIRHSSIIELNGTEVYH